MMLLWQANRLADEQHVLNVFICWKKRLSELEFCQNAAETPHINGKRIRASEDDFRRPVKSRLKVLINLFSLHTASPEIYQFYARLAPLLHHNIFRLDIAVNDLLLLQKAQRVQQLHSEYPNSILSQTTVIVGCDEFIQIPFQQLKGYALNNNIAYNMLPKHREILYLDNPTQVLFISFSNLSQNGDFHQSLLHNLLAPLDNLQRLHFLCLMIVHLDHFSKGSTIDGLNDLIAIRNMIPNLILIELTKLYSKITH